MQDVRGFCVVREALESQAARLFSEKASSDERLELRNMAVELDALWAQHALGNAKDRLFDLHQRHMCFHMRVVECTGVAALCQAMLRNNIPIFHWLYDVTLGTYTEPARWHQDLAAVLIERDPERADAAMRKHVRWGLEELLQRLEPYLSSNHFHFRVQSKNPQKRGLFLAVR